MDTKGMKASDVVMYRNGDQRDTGKSTGTSFSLCTHGGK